ncbi:hypothetical protein FXO37_10066 [Capsicum annuum]|nr:hypothetical protein FXO37_10066 [Capsicum annuum]
MASSTKITVEYAKSGRSACKKCDEKIPAKSVRLGLVSKHPQGFDQTKWHHLDCFPFSSDFVSSVENVTGFSLLESKDKETLEKLINKEIPALQKVSDADSDKIDRKQKETCAQLSATEEEPVLEIAFSICDATDTYKDATLLPKWRAFQTLIYLEQEVTGSSLGNSLWPKCKDEGLHASSKIAAFDFDGCLANTSVRRIYVKARRHYFLDSLSLPGVAFLQVVKFSFALFGSTQEDLFVVAIAFWHLPSKIS